jgi:transcriptional regulator with XRE-family HTH domain
MPEEMPQIAARIHDLRQIAGLSVEQVASDLQVPAATYAAYETGEADIPVGLLSEVAHRFGVELGTLLTGGAPRLHLYAVTRKGKGAEVTRRSRYRYRSLGDNFIQRRAEPFEVTVEPETDDAPYSLATHPGQEFDLVLEGILAISIDGHEIVLNEGDSVYYDSSLPHGMKAVGSVPARFLAVIL